MNYLVLLLVLAFSLSAELPPPPPTTDSIVPIHPSLDPEYKQLLLERAKKFNASPDIRQSRTYGTLSLSAGNASGVGIYEAGHLIATTPSVATKLSSGLHAIRLSHQKYFPLEDTLRISAGSQDNINFPLIQIPGTIRILTNPSGVKISVNSKNVGTTSDSGLTLPLMEPGQYIVQMEKAGYQTIRRPLLSKEGEAIGMNVIMLPKPASIKVVTPDDGFFVYVNNIYRGRTPLKVNFLRPGQNSVRVEQEKFAATTLTVLLKAEDTAHVAFQPVKDKTVRNVSPYGELKGAWGDKDGDGLPNDMDQCPEDPEDIDNWEDSDGCPDPDNDGDAVSDIKEMDNKYRDMAEDFDGFQDSDGKPEPDNDGDYIPDSSDLCMNLAEDRDGYMDLDGCPDPDNDNDGVSDKDDQAINEPEDKDGFQDKDGVQDLDNDNDGVRDYLDLCRDSAEVFNNFQDDDGCPDVRIAEIPKGPIARMLYALDGRLPDSVLIQIDSIYNAMSVFPDMTVEIKIHSDNRGNAPKKLETTKQFAALVQAYLDARSTIDNTRYTIIGVGGSDPLASNVSEEGRMRNTRIEIKRIK